MCVRSRLGVVRFCVTLPAKNFVFSIEEEIFAQTCFLRTSERPHKPSERMEQNTQEAIVTHEEHLSVPTVPTRTTRGAPDTLPVRLRCVSNKTISCADGQLRVVDALRCFSTIPDDAVRRVKKELGLPASSKISERDDIGGSVIFKGHRIVCRKKRPLGLVFYRLSSDDNTAYVVME